MTWCRSCGTDPCRFAHAPADKRPVTVEGLMREVAEARARLHRHQADVRAAVLEAERACDREPGNQARRFYAIGLRAAAGLLGMPEGQDPRWRTG